MHDHTQWTVDEFLSRVASRTPTPGGGGVTGLAGALACAMARMVVAYSVTKNTPQADQDELRRVASELERADVLMRTLVTRDAEAYQRMVHAARRLREDPCSAEAHQEAVLEAIGVPMQMGAVASAALSVMDQGKALASRAILSDLAIAALLAEAVARAAGCTILANVGDVSDPALRDRIRADAGAVEDHCRAATDRILGFVRGRLAGS